MLVSKASSRTLHLVSFKLGEEEFGLDINQVREINRPTQITKIPNFQGYVCGIINLRGQIVPVIDLKNKFDLPQEEISKDTRIIVVGFKELGWVAMIVDSVCEVLHLSEDSLAPPPKAIKGVRLEFIHAIAKTEGRLVLILDLSRLFTESEILQIKSDDLWKRQVESTSKPLLPSSQVDTTTDLQYDTAMQKVKNIREDKFQAETDQNLHGKIGELVEWLDEALHKFQNVGPDIKMLLSHLERIVSNHDVMAVHAKELDLSTGSNDASQSQIAELRRLVDMNQNELAHIMNALSFQGSTGQKIQEILVLLEEMEAKASRLSAEFGIPEHFETEKEKP